MLRGARPNACEKVVEGCNDQQVKEKIETIPETGVEEVKPQGGGPLKCERKCILGREPRSRKRQRTLGNLPE